MKKLYLATLFASLIAVSAAAQDEAPTVITAKPAGETVDLYRTSTGFESFYGTPQTTSSTGDWQRMVFGTDGAVYLENPINSLYANSWIKGYRAGGDTIAFDLPQAIYFETNFFTGELDYGYLRVMRDDSDGSYEADPDTQTLKYVWRNDSLIMAEGMVSGMCLASGGWTGYGEATYVAHRQAQNTVTPPDGADMHQSLMLYMDLDEQSQVYPVTFAVDGSDVYLGDLSTNVKGRWIKGTLEGDSVTFPASSFLAIDTVSVSYVYASSGRSVTAPDQMGGTYNKAELTGEPIKFAYDREAQTLSTKGALVIHKSADDLRSSNVFDFYRYAMLSPWTKKAEEPLPPVFTGYQAYEEMFGYGGLEFKLSYYSVSGNYLDPANLYYTFYIDDEVQTFSPDEYQYVRKPMTDVPYSFSDQYDFYRLSDNQRRVYFYKGPETSVGMEAVYIDGDTRLVSTRTTYNVNPTGIESANTTGSVESVTYTDLTGRRVARPTHGVYVRTVKYADGTTKSVKVAR